MKFLKTIFSLDNRKRVNFIQNKNGHFYFEEEHFSDEPLEMCWLPITRQLSICDSIDTAIREAKGNIHWLDEEWDQIDPQI